MAYDSRWTTWELGVPPALVRTFTRDDIGVVFQPIVDIHTGRLFAHEALVRCKKPEYGSPPVLFEQAVLEGVCGRLGRLIRDVAFATCGPVPLFVNVHPDELASPSIVQPDEPIGFHEAPVFLEVTESAAITHFDLCLGVLRELSARTGARLVIDDFGAGYSNLDRLATLEPAMVKLDIALINGIHKNPRRQSVVRHVVSLCNELDARVVAEGIQSGAELSCVRDLGVHYAQGFLLAYPATPPPTHVWPVGGAPRRTLAFPPRRDPRADP